MARITQAAVASLMLAAGMASTAQAGFFSFASDSEPSRWTFTGPANDQLADTFATPGNGILVQLLVNDHNGGTTLAYNTALTGQFNMGTGTAIRRGTGNAVEYLYTLAGSFTFVDLATGRPLLSASFEEGFLSSLGLGQFDEGGALIAGSWGSTATIQANTQASFVSYQWFGPDLPSYDLFNNQTSTGPADLAFTLSVINTNGGTPLPAGAPRGTPLSLPDLRPNAPGSWYAEGSYSGSALFVPTPGSLVLTAAGLLCMPPKRRRAAR
jgi:hypothetical protein